jgi:hypothetical protein
MEHKCEYCQNLITDKNKKRNRFCNRSCSNAWQHANGKRRDYVNDKSTMEWWIEKYGLDEALKRKEEWKRSVSLVTAGDKNPMYGKNYQTHGFIAENNRRKGKNNAEIYGKEKAEAISKKLSEKCSGSKNPAYEKVYENRGKSRCQGAYKGIHFRSTYEISFLVHLESLGVDLTDVVSEPFCIKYEFKGTSRTYRPDFLLDDVLYEIKPKGLLSLDVNLAKIEVAIKFCNSENLNFKIMTEEDFKILTIQEIILIDDIIWNEKAKEYLTCQR